MDIKRLLHSNTGFTMLETVAATAMLVMAIMISGSAYSYLGARSQRLDQKRGINSLNASLNRTIAEEGRRMWVDGLGRNGCDPSAALAAAELQFSDDTKPNDSFDGTEYDVRILDRARLNNLFVAEPALGAAVNLMSAAYGGETDPGARCSDSTVLADPQYAVIANSERNQAICRCGLAKGGYATLMNRIDAATMRNKSGFFACAIVQPSAQASSSQTRNTLNQGALILESVVAGVNIQTSTPIPCSGLATSDPLKTVYRFDYVMHWMRQNGGANQLPLKIAGNLVLE